MSDDDLNAGMGQPAGDERCNKNFGENSKIWIQACTYESSMNHEVDCGAYKSTTA